MKRTFFAGVVLCLVMCSGCGDSVDANRPKTYPVSGTVTQGGQPVADANVTFQSKDGSRGAVGLTDANGNFQLTTFTAGDGAVAGEHEVSITKYDQPKITPKGDGSIGDTGDEPETPEKKGAGTDADSTSMLPAKYADPKTSGIMATVTDAGDNKFQFNLD